MAQQLQKKGRIMKIKMVVLWFIFAVTILLIPNDMNFTAVHSSTSSTIPVTNVSELIAAINTANANGSSHFIITLAPGTYPLISAIGANGLPIVTGHITIVGGGAENTAISRSSSAPRFRIIEIATGGNLTLDRVTIKGGHSQASFNVGGGILNYGTVTITNSKVQSNSAVEGGGVSHRGNAAQLTNSLFENNQALGGGGGLFNSGDSMTVSNSTFKNNTGDRGGAIFTRTILNISNSTFQDNNAGFAGGAIFQAGVTTISSSVFKDNHADTGGALYANGTLALNFSTVTRNSAQVSGGGITVGSLSVMTVTNNVFSHNFVAGWRGGGLYINGTAVITENIFHSNRTDSVSWNPPASLGSAIDVFNDGHANASIHNNCIVGNGVISVRGSANATSNWWGSSSGPAVWVVDDPFYGSYIIIGGSGDAVNEYVSYGGWLGASNCATLPVPEPLPDLRVSHVEVGQAVLNDQVPLIANKPTLVRVYVQLSDAESAPVSGVYAKLHVQDEQGQEQTYISGPITATSEAPNSEDYDDSINFILDGSDLTGNVTLWAEVDPDKRIPEGNETNNSFDPFSKTFNHVNPFSIGYVAINYNGILPNRYQLLGADAYLASIYPVENLNYFPLPVSVPYLGSPSATSLIGMLNTIYRLYEITGWPQPTGQPDQLFGWVPSTSWGLDGHSDPEGSGRVSFGSDSLTNKVYQIIMAHEIGHNLGRRHPICDGADPNWPHNDYGIHDLGFDFGIYDTYSLVPDDTDDFMIGEHCGANVYDDKWTSAYTYENLFLKLTGSAITSFQQETLTEIPANTQILLVNGKVFEGSGAIIDTAYQITSTQTVNQPVGTIYCLSLENGGGSELTSSCFDVSFIDPETGLPITEAFFVHSLPFDTEAERLILSNDSGELTSKVISLNTPTVKLLTPNDGTITDETLEIAWSADDLDGDSLSYIVSYSTDNGQTWYYLGVGITEKNLLVNTDILAGSDEALFKIVASDGINTSEDISDDIVNIPKHEPEALILSPESGLTMLSSQSILLNGKGYDLEDGILDDNTLHWNSNLSGALGYGRTLAVSGLKGGTHIITLTATDSDNNIGTATITVFVPEIYLPVILRNP